MLIKKEDLPSLTIGFMNEIHDEDRKIINNIYDLILKYEQEPSYKNKINLNTLFQTWFNHTVKHFTNEEKRMKSKNFPLYEEHKQEHTRTLAHMHTIFSEWQESDDIQVLKHYFENELPKWIVEHIESMDLEAAQFFDEHPDKT